MNLIKVCAQTPEQKERYRKLLRGDWIYKDLFYPTGGRTLNVSATSFLSTICNYPKTCDVIRCLNDLDRGFSRYAIMLRPPSMRIFYFVEGAKNARKPEKRSVTYFSSVQDTVASHPSTIEFFELPSSAYFEIDNQSAYVSAMICGLIWRKQLGYYFPQFMRVLHRTIVCGVVDYHQLMQMAEKFNNKFAIAALKLAKRGFKSKRFKARPLVIGEQVRRYYDRWALTDCRSKLPLGKVIKIDYDTVHLNNGDIYSYSDRPGSTCEIWPVSR